MAGRKERQKPNWEMKRRVENHGFLRKFYNSWLPYSEEFKQMCNVIKKEFGEVNHAIALGWRFNTIKNYHQAAQRDPDEIYLENVRVQNEHPIPDLVIIVPSDLWEEFQRLPVEEQDMIIVTLIQDEMREFHNNRMSSYEARDVT